MNREAATGETPRDETAKDAGAGDSKGSRTGKASKALAQGESADVGKLLRGAYRETIEEAIPDDLMDLLNKLE